MHFLKTFRNLLIISVGIAISGFITISRLIGRGLCVFLEVYHGAKKVDNEQCSLAEAGRELLLRQRREAG